MLKSKIVFLCIFVGYGINSRKILTVLDMKWTQLEFVNRKKVESDYEVLQERLRTLPDKLSYDIMVCTLYSSQKIME